jgi:hypothetical protein
MRLPWFNGHNRYRKDLSSYVDGELGGAEARRLEAHLESCVSCREELDELRLTVLAVRDMPEEPAPRSFALTPEQVSETPPPVAGGVAYSPAVNTGMRLAAGALAVALAVVVFVDVGDVGRDSALEPARVSDDMAVADAPEKGIEDEILEDRSEEPYAPPPDTTPVPVAPVAGGVTAGDAPEPQEAEPRAPGVDTDGPEEGVRPGTAIDVPETDFEPRGSGFLSPDREPPDVETYGDALDDVIDDQADRAPVDDAESAAVTAAAEEDSGPRALLIAQIGLAAALGVVLGGLFVLSRMRSGGRA